MRLRACQAAPTATPPHPDVSGQRVKRLLRPQATGPRSHHDMGVHLHRRLPAVPSRLRQALGQPMAAAHLAPDNGLRVGAGAAAQRGRVTSRRSLDCSRLQQRRAITIAIDCPQTTGHPLPLRCASPRCPPPTPPARARLTLLVLTSRQEAWHVAGWTGPGLSLKGARHMDRLPPATAAPPARTQGFRWATGRCALSGVTVHQGGVQPPRPPQSRRRLDVLQAPCSPGCCQGCPRGPTPMQASTHPAQSCGRRGPASPTSAYLSMQRQRLVAMKRRSDVRHVRCGVLQARPHITPWHGCRARRCVSPPQLPALLAAAVGGCWCRGPLAASRNGRMRPWICAGEGPWCTMRPH